MATPTNRGKIYPPIEYSYAKEHYGIDELEWEKIVDRMGRNPNDMEAAIFSMLWSESYCNKSSASLLESIDRETTNVIKLAGSKIGLIDIGNNEYLAVRAVANNEHSYIDTFYGIQTCIDMALTELSVVGAKPLGVLNLMRFGQYDQIANQKLFLNAVNGIGQYTNAYGIPAIGGEIYFHKQYNMSTMINSCAIGLLKTSNPLKKEKPPIGTSVIYIGAKTGLDGLRREKTEGLTGIANRKYNKTIKISDPLLSNRLINACYEAISKGLMKDVVSANVGGLGTACFDLAARIENPIRLEINRIPLKTEGLSPKDILLSESGDRLLALAPKEDHRKLVDIFHKWDIDSTVVGQVVDEDGLQFFWNHYQAADIPFQFAMGGSTQKHFQVVKFPPMLRRSDSAEVADAIRKRKRKVEDEWTVVRDTAEGKDAYTGEIDVSHNLEDTWLDLLANPNICSRRPVYKLFDQAVGLSSIVSAGGDAAVIRLRESNTPNRALALSMDANSLYVNMEPYLGTVQTVAEGMRNLAASGARPIGIATCLNFGNPNNYKEVCDLSESIRGLGDASKIWNIPILSDFVSLFNGSDGIPTLGTPTIISIGMLENAAATCNISFKNRGDKVFLIGITLNEIGCSEYGYYCHNQVNRLVPDINFDLEKRTCDVICQLVEKGLLQSSHDISNGGLAIAFSECCLSGDKPIGAVLNLENTLDAKEFRKDALLFSETSGRFIISFKKENEEAIRKICLDNKIAISAEGEVGGRDIEIKGAVDCVLPLTTTYKIWARRLNNLLGFSQRKENN